MKMALQALLWMVLAVAFLYLAGGVGLMVVAGSALQAELSELKGSGQPLSASSLLPPAPPESENAAPIFDLAVRKLEKLTEDDLRKLSAWADKPAGDDMDIQAILAQHRTALDEAVSAGGRPKFWLAYTPGEGFPQVKLLPEMVRAARALKARVVFHALKKRPIDALRDWSALLHISRCLRQLPILNSLSLGSVVTRLAVEAWPHVQASVGDASALLEASTLDDVSNRALAMELMNGVMWICDAGGEGPIQKPLLARTLWAPMRNLDALHYLRACRAALKEIRKPYPEARKALADLHGGLDAPPFYAPYSAMILPSFDGAAQQLALEKASLQMLGLAIALQKSKDVPLPVNPYTGRPWTFDGARLDGGHPSLQLQVK